MIRVFAGAGAGSRNWSLWRYGADLSYQVTDAWTLTGRLRGQQAGDQLIPGEQFGLGGAYSVRGFRELAWADWAAVAAFDDAVDAWVRDHRSPVADRVFYGLSSAADHSLLWNALVALRGATKVQPGRIGAPVTVGGVEVAAGDWVVGDTDGVAVIPGDALAAVLNRNCYPSVGAHGAGFPPGARLRWPGWDYVRGHDFAAAGKRASSVFLSAWYAAHGECACN